VAYTHHPLFRPYEQCSLAAEALAALLDAASKLPATFIAHCAFSMFTSAARGLLGMNVKDHKEALE
jgi:hypothetical protein